MALEITDQTIGDVLQQDKLVMIDFWAAWCGPCKMMAPIIDELSETNPDVIIGKVDVSDNPKAAIEYMVSSLPSFLFIKNGEVVDKVIGAVPKKVLQAKISENK